MKFTHLVEINDPLNPLIDPLSREQLWRGLLLRAEDPARFVPWLDACEIIARSEEAIRRRLRYGDLVITDTVQLSPQRQLHYRVPPQKDISESSLLVTIEEPQAGVLLVRFEYDDGNPDATGTPDDFYNEYKRSAYTEADVDTIRLIRQLAADGLLGRAPQ